MELTDRELTDRELLIRIDERVEELRRDMKLAKSETGFARCQVHAEKVEALKTAVVWSRRTVIGGIIALIIKAVYDHW